MEDLDPQEPTNSYDWQPSAENSGSGVDDSGGAVNEEAITAPEDWGTDETADLQASPSAAERPPVPSLPMEVSLDPESTYSTIVWYPMAEPSDNPEIAAEDTTQLEINGEIREVSAKVLDMAAKFNATQDERSGLEHDCSVFAMATETGDSYEGEELPVDEVQINCEVTFWEGTAEEVIARGVAEAVPPGTIIFAGQGPGDIISETQPFHYLVKASTDEGPALFASKLGGGNPVCISDLPHVVRMYQAEALGIATGFHLEPVDPERR